MPMLPMLPLVCAILPDVGLWRSPSSPPHLPVDVRSTPAAPLLSCVMRVTTLAVENQVNPNPSSAQGDAEFLASGVGAVPVIRMADVWKLSGSPTPTMTTQTPWNRQHHINACAGRKIRYSSTSDSSTLQPYPQIQRGFSSTYCG